MYVECVPLVPESTSFVVPFVCPNHHAWRASAAVVSARERESDYESIQTQTTQLMQQINQLLVQANVWDNFEIQINIKNCINISFVINFQTKLDLSIPSKVFATLAPPMTANGSLS